jgi:hypothetical protein
MQLQSFKNASCLYFLPRGREKLCVAAKRIENRDLVTCLRGWFQHTREAVVTDNMISTCLLAANSEHVIHGRYEYTIVTEKR